MATFNVPKQQSNNIFTIPEFLGIDLFSNNTDIRRSPNMVNVKNDNGLCTKRPFIRELIGYYGLKEDLEDTGIVLDFFRFNSDTWIKVSLYDNKISLFEYNKRTDEDTYAVYRIGGVYDIIDKGWNSDYVLFHKIGFGDGYLLYFGTPFYSEDGGSLNRLIQISMNEFGSIESETIYDRYENINTTYLPTIVISSDNDTGLGTQNEPINLMNEKVKQSFLITEPFSFIKLLPSKIEYNPGGVNGNECYIDVLQLDGTVIRLTSGVDFTVDTQQDPITKQYYGVLAFVPQFTPPSTVDGKDNFTVEYYYTQDEFSKLFDRIPTKSIVYGYENNDRLFVSFNTNIDFHSAPNDPTYFPGDNFSVIGGNSPITGYALLNGKLLTIKDSLNTLWLRNGLLLNDIEVFNSERTYQQEQIYDVIQTNERVFAITYKGIYELSLYNEKLKYYNRSLFINTKLNEYLNIEDCTFAIDENYIYIKNGKLRNYSSSLCEDGDGTFNLFRGSLNITHRNKYEDDYQFEWCYWNNIPIGNLFLDFIKVFNGRELGTFHRKYVLCIKNHTQVLYLEDTGDKLDTYNFYESISFPIETLGETSYQMSKRNVKKQVKSYWETPFLNFGTISYAKTIRNIYLNTRNGLGDGLELGYILPDGTTQIISKIHETDNGGFPQLIQEREKIRKFMWIKFYIKSVDDKVIENNLTHLWKFTSNGNDAFGNNNVQPNNKVFYSNDGMYIGGNSSALLTERLKINEHQPISWINPSIDYDIDYNKDYSIGFEIKPFGLPRPPEEYELIEVNDDFSELNLKYIYLLYNNEETLKTNIRNNPGVIVSSEYEDDFGTVVSKVECGVESGYEYIKRIDYRDDEPFDEYPFYISGPSMIYSKMVTFKGLVSEIDDENPIYDLLFKNTGSWTDVNVPVLTDFTPLEASLGFKFYVRCTIDDCRLYFEKNIVEMDDGTEVFKTYKYELGVIESNKQYSVILTKKHQHYTSCLNGVVTYNPRTMVENIKGSDVGNALYTASYNGADYSYIPADFRTQMLWDINSPAGTIFEGHLRNLFINVGYGMTLDEMENLNWNELDKFTWISEPINPTPSDLSFDMMQIEWQPAGKYRGE